MNDREMLMRLIEAHAHLGVRGNALHEQARNSFEWMNDYLDKLPTVANPKKPEARRAVRSAAKVE